VPFRSVAQGAAACSETLTATGTQDAHRLKGRGELAAILQLYD